MGDHSDVGQKNSIESIESGYGSERISNKCDICENICKEEPIVVWFADSERQKTDTTTEKNKSEDNGTGDSRSSIVSVAYLCNGCFAENSPIMAQKLKKKSRIHGYKPASCVISNSPEAMNHDEEAASSKSSLRRRDRKCSVIVCCALILVVILFLLLVILISTGTLQAPSTKSENVATQSKALNQDIGSLRLDYMSLLEKLNALTNQTIRYQNEVDVVLSNHTAALMELSRHVNKTRPTTDFKLESSGNTQCNYYKPRQRTSASVSETRTPWYPSEDDTDMTITGVECSVKGGVSSQLETRQMGELTQYSCVCPAQTDTGSLIHTCAIHVWSCSPSSI